MTSTIATKARFDPDTPLDRIITTKELLGIVPYSAMHVWRLERDGKFPGRIQIGPNRVGWSLREIMAWVEAKKAAREEVA